MSLDFRQAYHQELERINQGITAMARRVVKEWKLRQYCYAFANYKALMPQLVEGKKGEEVFVDMLKVRARTPLDYKYIDLIDDINYLGHHQVVTELQKGPFIFCSYHLGSFRKIVSVLARFGYDFSLIVDRGVYETQKDVSEALVKEINARYGTSSDFEIINAENFGAAMTMTKQLKSGRSIVAYIDGNRGTGGAPKDDKQMLKVNFLGQQLHVRKGLSYISFLTGIPILPVISFRRSPDDISVYFYEPIDPVKATSRKAFCQATTQRLYDILEERLLQYPLQWEGWLYIHKYLDTDNLIKQRRPEPDKQATRLTPRSQLRFNDKRYGLYQFGNQFHLFDFDTYLTYLIGKEEFQVLAGFKGGTTYKKAKKKVAADLFEELMAQEILRAA